MRRTSCVRFISLSLLLFAAALITSCSEVKDSSEDAFITPIGENAETAEEAVGAGEPGIPAADLETIYFPFDSSVITPSAAESLRKNAAYLRDNPTVSIQVEGHCDERGTLEYNMALGERRASAARTYLKKLGIEDSRLSVISYGEERPEATGHDEASWEKNRRAAFVVVGQ